jgi:hypothetical protein
LNKHTGTGNARLIIGIKSHRNLITDQKQVIGTFVPAALRQLEGYRLLIVIARFRVISCTFGRTHANNGSARSIHAVHTFL